MYYNLVRRLGGAEWKYISGYIGRNISLFTFLDFWNSYFSGFSAISREWNELLVLLYFYIQTIASWNFQQNLLNSHLLLLFATFVQNEKAAAARKHNTDLNIPHICHRHHRQRLWRKFCHVETLCHWDKFFFMWRHISSVMWRKSVKWSWGNSSPAFHFPPDVILSKIIQFMLLCRDLRSSEAKSVWLCASEHISTLLS